jgi:hypothetical protein
MNTPLDDVAAARARQRFGIMNAARIGGLAMVLVGIAITQGVVPAPYPLGVVLGCVGIIEFFFLPPLLARRWSTVDRDSKGPDER